VSLEDTAEAMEKYPDAAAVLITSPNYYGMAAETEKIADLVHSRGKLLIVDEAHGAHLSFAEGILTDEGKGSAFPEDALRSGADIVVQSAHKTLPALTQTAFLHIKYRDSYLSARDGDRLERILASMQTTSPSWLLMASADLARDIMMREGYSKLKQLFTDIIMSERKYGIFNACTDSNSTPGKDPTRLVFNTEDTGMSGYAFAGILAEKYNINVEMSDLFNVVCIATVSHNKYDIEYLFKSISDAKAAIKQDASIKQCNKEECAANAAAYLVKAPKAEMEIYEAFHSNEVLLNIEDSTGRISAGTIVPYPPGIPVLHPGEVITEEHIRALNLLARQGAEINGISYGKLMVIEL
jgi:arginine decarboxylase